MFDSQTPAPTGTVSGSSASRTGSGSSGAPSATGGSQNNGAVSLKAVSYILVSLSMAAIGGIVIL